MSKEYKYGFLIFNKEWLLENEFFNSLSHAEFKIMVYLLSSRLIIKKRDQRYKRGDLLAKLYQVNNLLVVNVSIRTISEKCMVSRATVCKALEKFDIAGAAIRISQGQEDGENNIYIVGFKGPASDGEEDYFFVDSTPIKKHGAMQKEYRDNIAANFNKKIFSHTSEGWKNLFEKEESPESILDDWLNN